MKRARKPWKICEDEVTVDAIALLGTWAWKTKAKDRDLGDNGSSAKEAKALFGLMPLQK